MSDRLSDYDFDLPRELIASRPPAVRGDSRMLVIDRAAQSLQHRHFTELPEFLDPGDLLVFNNSRVIPARLLTANGKIELLVFDKVEPLRWRAFARPGKSTRPGDSFEIAGTAAVIESVDDDDGTRIVRFAREPDFDNHGHMPIPPYLGREDDEEDRVRYQTVYAQEDGSVAAPTAGLHFTPQMMQRVPHTFVTLHVGPGTFLPVRTENLDEHRMHAENFRVDPVAAEAINQARRVIAVGTTSLRVLESLPPGPVAPTAGRTDIFIRPGYRLKHTQALLTNFHLPKSTLFMLVCALGGGELMRRAYTEAVRKKYRFFSYGDCMLII